MNLHKLFKELMPITKSVLSDTEILALNRRDYYTGEASPIDGFLSMFEEFNKIKTYQEYELMNNIVSIIKKIKTNKNLYIEVYAKNVEKIALFLYCNIYNEKTVKIKFINGKYNIIPKNEYAEKIYQNYMAAEVKNSPKKSDTVITFVDALEELDYEKVNDNMQYYDSNIIVALNGTNIETKEKKNPFSDSNIHYIFSISGGLIAIKN